MRARPHPLQNSGTGGAGHGTDGTGVPGATGRKGPPRPTLPWGTAAAGDTECLF